MKLLLIIGIGGFLGSISRYLLHLSISRLVPVIFPMGTFMVNMLGCLLLGMIFSLAEHHKVLNNEWRLFLAVGFCGSFTTFSTLALEGMLLIQQKEWLVFFSYMAGSLILGLLFTALGYFLFTKLL